MPDNPNSAAGLRARRDHHAATKAAAEAERTRLLAEKAGAGARLSDVELDDVDAEIARLGVVIERAASRVGMIGPALAKAEAAEADADDSRNTAAMAAQNRRTISGVVGTFGDRAAGKVIMTLTNAPVRQPSPTIFEAPPAPKITRDDDAFWEARRGREREAKAARRLSAKA